MRYLLLPTLLTAPLLTLAQAPALNRVANYYAGQPGTASYRHLSFWSHEGHRYNMQYSYGPRQEEITARYAGTARVGGQPGFRVALADGHSLYVVPSGQQLRVSASPTAPSQLFRWEYEGPVNGVGTACSVCADDAAAAMRLLRRYYL